MRDLLKRDCLWTPMVELECLASRTVNEHLERCNIVGLVLELDAVGLAVHRLDVDVTAAILR